MAESSMRFDLDLSIARYLAHAPLSLCLRELNRILGLLTVEKRIAGLPGAVLDVGCGDGFWWTALDRAGRTVHGVDISASETGQAGRVLDGVEVADVSKTRPFVGRTFDLVIGNCSLEHVPDIDGALRNLRLAAAADARLVMFVPTPTWAIQGHTQRFLMSRFPRLAMAFAGALNGFFQHWHLYDHAVWRAILASNGWRVEHAYGLGGRRSEFLFRAFLPTGFLSWSSASPATTRTASCDSCRRRSWPRSSAWSGRRWPRRSWTPGTRLHTSTCWWLAPKASMSADYFSNHRRASRFPWSLYHRPLERDLGAFLASLAADRRAPRILVMGAGYLHELPSVPRSARLTVADIDARVIDRLAGLRDERIERCVHLANGRELDGLGTFDGIYAKEVVEHLADASSWVRDLAGRLATGGRLWLSTPNYGDALLPLLESTVLELIGRWSGYSRKGIHPTRFTLERLERILISAGLEPTRVFKTPFRLALVGEARRRSHESGSA